MRDDLLLAADYFLAVLVIMLRLLP